MAPILGVDPGLADTGWAVLGDGPRVLEAGLVKTPAGDPLPDRLRRLHLEIAAVVARAKPSALALEELFFTPMARTQFATVQARGVILLAAAQAGVPVCAYNPRIVKQALTGSGAAAKPQMQRMVARLLGLAEVPKPDDVADAMAIALCHQRVARFRGMVRK